MTEILIKAICFVLMIALGYTLKKIGFFHTEDFTVLSKIVLNITLPCAVITNFSGFAFEPTLILLVLGFSMLAEGIREQSEAGQG